MSGKKKAPTTTELVKVGPVAELSVAWQQWMEKIPPAERRKVADLTEKADTQSLAGINALCQLVLVSIFRGELSPAVAEASRPWVELMIENIKTMHYQGGTVGAKRDVLRAIVEIERTARLEPTYTTTDVIDDGPEPMGLLPGVASELEEALPPEPGET